MEGGEAELVDVVEVGDRRDTLEVVRKRTIGRSLLTGEADTLIT